MMTANLTLMITMIHSLMMTQQVSCYLNVLLIVITLCWLTGNSSSSYGGESEDEDWSPGGGGGGSVDEDIDELMADANTFISNKKMQRPS